MWHIYHISIYISYFQTCTASHSAPWMWTARFVFPPFAGHGFYLFERRQNLEPRQQWFTQKKSAIPSSILINAGLPVSSKLEASKISRQWPAKTSRNHLLRCSFKGAKNHAFPSSVLVRAGRRIVIQIMDPAATGMIGAIKLLEPRVAQRTQW